MKKTKEMNFLKVIFNFIFVFVLFTYPVYCSELIYFASVEEVMMSALEVEYTPKRGFGRKAGEGSVWGKVLFGTTPVRKGNVQLGDTVYNKKDGSANTVIFVNDTIVVYEEEHEEGTQ
ncbi:MAG: hypothetical protein EOM23_00525, partial [Candidatus Moranbacteria bacterium]|nr:hypothetical protein [Candidatus Moranbacteria bacterium]